MARQGAAHEALARIQAGAIKQGMRDLTAILDASRADKDELCESLVLGYLAYGMQLNGRPDDALPLITAALEIDGRTDNAVLTAQHLRGAGAVHHQRGELSEAAAYYRRATDVVPTAEEARSLGVQVADLGKAYASRGDRLAAIRCHLLAIDVLLRAKAPQIEAEVRDLLAANLYPLDAQTLAAAALVIANRRNEIAALSVLRTDGILMRGGDYLLMLGDPLQVTFFDATGRNHDVDPGRIAGIAMIDADGRVTAAFGLHPD
jgi:tetratricopeptide (TPR) repeat protein